MRSSSTSSFARSVSIIRDTGMPVQALTTSAISSGPDLLPQQPSRAVWPALSACFRRFSICSASFLRCKSSS